MADKPHIKIFLTLMISALALSACNTANSQPTPTEIGIEAVYTSAAQTVEAQLTGTAAAQPSPTLTPSPTETVTITPTLGVTNTPAATALPPISGGSTGGAGAVGCNNSAYVADVTIPDNQQIAPGTTFTKTWKVQNTGTCAWNTNYKLTFVRGDAMGGVSTPINQTVNPGATADISVTLTAPSTSKTYVGYWTLSTDTGQAFGGLVYVQIVVAGTPVTPGTGTVLPSPTATFGAVGCYNAMLVSASPQDGVNIKAGDTFRKTWVIKNTGTCEWNSDFRFVYISGDILRDNTTNRLRRGTIKTNGTIEYYLDFTAPTAPGTYTSTWRLMTDTGTLFGPSFTSRIVVPGATFTPTVQPSVTPPPTVTPTPTATATISTYP